MRDADRRRLVDALAFVLEAGGDAAQAAAALLHDTLEDGEDVTAEQLRREFGADVAEIVVACSDLLPDDTRERKSRWSDRKRRYLAQLASAAPRVRLVAACDKLHNLRTLIADLREHGPDTLARFTASPEQTRWYYESAHAALRDAVPPAIR